MPELPEVEITCQSLKQPLIGCTFTNILTRREGLRYPFPKYLKDYLLHYKVVDLYRKAKYIIIVLENSFNLIIHLGMSGRLKIIKDIPLQWHKHDHVVFTLQDQAPLQGNRSPLQNRPSSPFMVVYNDPRRFGLMDIIATADLPTHRYFSHLGPEPLDEKFTLDHFINQLQKTKRPLKHSLLDQKILVGIGNIYACEALFQAGLSPYRESHTLQLFEYLALYTALRQILAHAITVGGSSFKDYHHIDGKKGQFQSFFKVYNQHTRTCPRCNISVIHRVVQQGRSTFYCKECQN